MEVFYNVISEKEILHLLIHPLFHSTLDVENIVTILLKLKLNSFKNLIWLSLSMSSFRSNTS